MTDEELAAVIFAVGANSVDDFFSRIINVWSTAAKFKKCFQAEKTKTKVLLFTDCCKGIVYKDKFYFGSSHRGFYFVVFDSQGNMLYEIDRQYKKIPVTDDIKNLMMAPVNNSKRREEYYKKFEPSFPEFFPAFANFAIGNDML